MLFTYHTWTQSEGNFSLDCNILKNKCRVMVLLGAPYIFVDPNWTLLDPSRPFPWDPQTCRRANPNETSSEKKLFSFHTVLYKNATYVVILQEKCCCTN